MEQLPHENIIYFGDTAHLPYGEKSIAAIQSYSIKITNFLLAQHCKLILIACNTASAAAFELIKEYVGDKALVANVVDPVVDWVANTYPQQHIGLIATRATVASGSYQRKLRAKGITKVSALATPLLASVIEEGFFNNTVSKVLIEKYLIDSKLKDIEVLILGCTHYPLIKKEIENFYQNTVEVVEGGQPVARYVKDLLQSMPPTTQHNGSFEGYVSDLTESFEASTKIFLGRRVKLKELRID